MGGHFSEKKKRLRQRAQKLRACKNMGAIFLKKKKRLRQRSQPLRASRNSKGHFGGHFWDFFGGLGSQVATRVGVGCGLTILCNRHCSSGNLQVFKPGACFQDLVHAAWHNVPVYRLGPQTFKSEALPRKVADLKVFVSWGVFPTLFLRACSGCMAGARQEQCPCGPPGPKNL